MPDIHEYMEEERREHRDVVIGERCLVSTDADLEDDDVYVTYPDSDDPDGRERVDHWRPRVDSDGDARFPQRGDIGAVIELGNGELWLLF